MAASAFLKLQLTLNRNIYQIHDKFAICSCNLWLQSLVSGWQYSICIGLDSLENAPLKLFSWFSNNEMKTNLDKCHLPTTATASIATKIKDNEVLKSESEKLLRVAIDNKLSFKIIYKKYLKKLIRKFMF